MSGRLMNDYAGRFTWSHRLGEHCLAHHDGVISILCEWDGIDAELASEDDLRAAWTSLYQALHLIDDRHVMEWHLWREDDAALADTYLARRAEYVRGGELAQALRAAMAEHLGRVATTNTVAVVLSVLARPRLRGAKGALLEQSRQAVALEANARELCQYLPGGRVVSNERYLWHIVQSFHRDRWLAMEAERVCHDPRFLLNEQLIDVVPERVDDLLRVGRTHTKVLLLYLYPDAAPGWAFGLGTLDCAVHIAHVVRPINTRAAMVKSRRESNFTEGLQGDEHTDTKAAHQRGFRQVVAENALDVFQNCYVIHLHGEREQVLDAERSIRRMVGEEGQLRGGWYIQKPFLRAGLPGQGYRAPFLRPDHTRQVADMIPAQVFHAGHPQPDQLRIGQYGQAVGFSYDGDLNHSITLAMSRAGKDIEKSATIWETFPLGVDWYLCEIGRTHKWNVELLGGTYTIVDPDRSVVNPLPPYEAADPDGELPLQPSLVSGTMQALAYLLTNGRVELDHHEEAVASNALQLLYADIPPERIAPSLPDLLRELEADDCPESETQRQVAKEMAANLHSFLTSTTGRVFAGEDNLQLSRGITGVDLTQVQAASPNLLKFYVAFTSIKFVQFAFARRTPARVLLNELHALPGDMLRALVSGVARMGGKQGASIDLISQEQEEIDAIEKGVINQMQYKTLLYRQDGHEEIAARVGMPTRITQLWRDMENCIGRDYRLALRTDGERYHYLHLTFPQLLLDIATTAPADLEIKERVEKMTASPLERLQLFQQIKHEGLHDEDHDEVDTDLRAAV